MAPAAGVLAYLAQSGVEVCQRRGSTTSNNGRNSGLSQTQIDITSLTSGAVESLDNVTL